MDYVTLGAADLVNLQRRKLAEIETEHATLDLDLRLAAIAGIDNAAVAQGHAQLMMLDAQHAALCAWLDRPALTITPNEDDEQCPAS